ncbi:MAG: MBOAT family O-acyltransferase, partial [Atopobiaceae bacterium]|nr:MBOAT family O-acyltransferase [Atopobiaceae bacterium]
SLSTWLREYLYFPLGGNRKGRVRAVINRIVVFLVCGLWHGASWTFVVWGLVHGLFLLVEDVVPIRKLPKPLGVVYTVLVVTCAFVIFRADTLAEGMEMLGAMFCGASGGRLAGVLVVEQLTPLFLATALAGIVLASSLPSRFAQSIGWSNEGVGNRGVVILSYVCSIVLLVLCMINLSSGTYNPFIYFRF